MEKYVSPQSLTVRAMSGLLVDSIGKGDVLDDNSLRGVRLGSVVRAPLHRRAIRIGEIAAALVDTCRIPRHEIIQTRHQRQR